jgi:hypothetical protein
VTARRPDPPGTCHLVGCPDKGEHEPHPFVRVDKDPEPVRIGCGAAADYERAPDTITVPVAELASLLDLIASLTGISTYHQLQRRLAEHRNGMSVAKAVNP